MLLFLSVLGGLTLLSFLIQELWSPVQLILSYLKSMVMSAKTQSLSDKFGEWAVITGGTDGIGKQYALQLAKRGLNVVIISRNFGKLNAVASEIETLYKVKTKIVVADFSGGAEIYGHIEEEIKDIPIGILVNNVGVLYDYPMYFGDLPRGKVWEIINVNMGAVTCLTHIVLNGMVRRGRGAIVNISSAAELAPLPLLNIYGASKAYIQSFTIALRTEYGSKGIYVQHVSPMFVSTNMVQFSEVLIKRNILVPDAETFVRHAVLTLGRVDRTTGYWSHGIQIFLGKLFPVWILSKIGHLITFSLHRQHINRMKSESG